MLLSGRQLCAPHYPFPFGRRGCRAGGWPAWPSGLRLPLARGRHGRGSSQVRSHQRRTSCPPKKFIPSAYRQQQVLEVWKCRSWIRRIAAKRQSGKISRFSQLAPRCLCHTLSHRDKLSFQPLSMTYCDLQPYRGHQQQIRSAFC